MQIERTKERTKERNIKKTKGIAKTINNARKKKRQEGRHT